MKETDNIMLNINKMYGVLQLENIYIYICLEQIYTVEPLIAATFTAKVRWPLLGGDRYSEVYYKYGKAFGTEG